MRNRTIYLVLLLVVLYGLYNASASTRYTVQVDPAVYVAPYDANDPAYKLLAKVPADWLAEYGDNERTALLYNISLIRVNLKQLDDRLNSLLPPAKEPVEVAAEPNEPEVKENE